jgi:hypothetical protein
MAQTRLSDQEVKQAVHHDVASLNAHLRMAAEHGLHIEVSLENGTLLGVPGSIPQVAALLTRVERI